MDKLKLVWRVASMPTGRYRSFQRRGWPTADYAGTEKPAVFLECEDDYRPANVREGTHGLISVIVLHHNHEARKPWARMRLKNQFTTLQAAKDAAFDFLSRHPEYHYKAP